MHFHPFALCLLIASCNNTGHIETSARESSMENLRDCSLGRANGETVELQPIWKSQYVETRIAGSILPIIHDDVIIVSRTGDLDPPDELVAFNKHSGDQVWLWSDYFDYKENLGGDEGDYHVHEGMLVITSHAGMYVINIASGVTLWRKKVQSTKWGNYGEENAVYYSEKRSDRYVAVRTDLSTHEECILHYVPRLSGVTASFSSPYPTSSGSVVFTYNDYHFEQREPGHIVYSVSNNCIRGPKLLWQREIDSPGGNTLGPHTPAIYGEHIYLGGSEIYCINHLTGEVKWTYADRGAGAAGMVIADGKLIIGSEGWEANIYALDPDSGALLWSVPYGGNAHQFQVHNCVAYTVSGGDGLLYAVDIHSGKNLFEMSSPDREDDNRLSFGNCTVDPETNQIYLTNYRYLMCYALPEYN